MTKLLTVKQVCAWLNMKPSTLYQWANQGRIPCRKFYGLIRFDPDELVRWAESFTPSSASSLPPLGLNQVRTVDSLIAQAKRDVYTSARGKPDQDRATRKGDNHGSV
jgi:excisionase family DNA binding protein